MVKRKKVKNIIIEEVRKDMDSQRTLIKSLSSDLKDQREELEVAKRSVKLSPGFHGIRPFLSRLRPRTTKFLWGQFLVGLQVTLQHG